VARSRRIAVGLWLGGIAFCLFQVSQARFVADLSMFLPEAPTEEQRLLVDQLRDGALTRMAFIGIDGADAATRARLSATLKKKLETGAGPGPGLAPVFVSVANGQGSGFEKERELLLAHRYVLSPNVTPGRFTVEGLRAAVAETVELLASPAGMLVKPFVARDPTAEMLAVIERMRPEGGPPLIDGVWASRDGKRALLVARTRAKGSDTDAQALAVAAIERAFREAQGEIGPLASVAAATPGATKDATPGATTLVITGPAVFAVKSREMIRRDVEVLALASLGLVAGILLAAYRSALALALGLVPVISGALVGVSAVALGHGAVHGITLGFGTTLIGEAIDYSIYLFVQSERSREVGGADWIAASGRRSAWACSPRSPGSRRCSFSGLPGLAQLGVYSITGPRRRGGGHALRAAGAPARAAAVARSHPVGTRLLGAVATLGRARWLVIVVALAAVVVLATRDRLWDSDSPA
jgi:predicted exporter